MNPYVALAVVLAIAGAFLGGVHYEGGVKDTEFEAERQTARANAEHDARVQETTWKEKYDALRDKGQKDLAVVGRKLSAALVELRDRPERASGAATEVASAIRECHGASGRDLSGPDAEFLTREAAQCDTVIGQLNEAQGYIRTVLERVSQIPVDVSAR